MVAGCKQKMAAELMTFVLNFNLLWLLDLRKASFWIFCNMADTRANFKPNSLLFWILALPPFWIFSNMAETRGNFKLNFNLFF